MKFFAKSRNCVKKIFNPTDVYLSQRILINSSLIYGLIPYRLINKQGGSRLQTSVFGFIAAIIYVLFFGCCFMSTILNQMNVMEFFLKSPISNFGGNLNLITSFLSITSVYMSSLYLRKKVKKIFAILNRIDGKLFELGVLVNHRNAMMFNIRSAFVAFITYGIFNLTSMTFVLQNSSDRSRAPLLVTHYLPYLVITILMLTFLNFARLIRTRFEAANRVSSHWSLYKTRTRTKQLLRSFSLISYLKGTFREMNPQTATK